MTQGKAKYPHDTSRPSAQRVKKALEKGDMDALRLALTPRQLAFCKEYVTDFKGKEAAIRAGYSPKYADRQAYLNLMNEGIRAYIEHLQLSAQAKSFAISPEWVTKKTVEIINTAEKPGDQMRGLELIARILGMLKDRTEISGPDGEAIRIQNEKIEKEATEVQNLINNLAKKTTVYLEKPDE